eukprot:5549339-Prymnesium_polylepis.1
MMTSSPKLLNASPPPVVATPPRRRDPYVPQEPSGLVCRRGAWTNEASTAAPTPSPLSLPPPAATMQPCASVPDAIGRPPK